MNNSSLVAREKLTKELLQERMPVITLLVSRYRAVFGPGLKVLWAKEGEFEVGKLPQVRSYSGPFESSKPPNP